MPTIVFDFLGTLVRFDEVINVIWQTWQKKGLEQHRDAVTLFEDWYHTTMMDYVAASHSGLYRSFLKVLHGTLARSVYKALGILPLEDNMNRVVDTFRKKLIPTLDSLEALGLALAQGWNVWILTQGDKIDTWNYLKKYDVVVVDEEDNDQILSKLNHSGADNNKDKTRLGPVFVMSCDELKVAKPHPKVYAQVMRVTIRRTQKIENFYMVSSLSWDLEGAKNVSMRTVFLTNKEIIYPTGVYDSEGPDIQGTTLVDCVEKAVQYEKSLDLHYSL